MIDAFNHKENKIKLLAVMVVKVFLGLSFFQCLKVFQFGTKYNSFLGRTFLIF